MEKALTTSAIIVAFIWIIIITWYSIKNDFASEIMGVLIPAIGAIILSLFLGIKFVYYDAPKDIDPYRGAMVVLHNQDKNSLYGLGLEKRNYKSKTINKEGIKRIYYYPENSLFNEIGLKSNLAKDPLNKMIGEHGENDGYEFTQTVLDLLEYSFFDWLFENNELDQSWLNEEYIYKFPNGYSEVVSKKISDKMLSKIILNENTFPKNKMFSVKPISINLPYKSKISHRIAGAYEREILIKSKYSEIKVNLKHLSEGRVDNSHPSLKEFEYYGGISATDKITSSNFQIDMSQKIYKISRFAKEAKLHGEWFKSLKTKFNEAFSYEALIEN